jgi:hypothetical protein
VEQVLSHLSPLRHLPKLEIIYVVNICDPAIEEILDIWRNPSDSSLFDRLAEQYASLRTVYVKTKLIYFWSNPCVYHIWRRSSSVADWNVEVPEVGRLAWFA